MISSEMVMVGVGAAVALDLHNGTGLTWGTCKLAWAITVRSVRSVAWLVRAAPITFGSARWLKVKEAAGLGLLGASGLIVGRMGRRMLRFSDVEGSVVVFAPQGAGKGAGIVVPNLLTYEGSVICTDPKGENHAVTARARRAFGPVYCIDVANLDHSHRFNPMEGLRRDELLAVDDCHRLAQLLMPKGPQEDDHWRTRSVSILTGFILWVMEQHGDTPDRCNLGTVDELLSAPVAEVEDTLELMLGSRHMVVRSAAARLQSSLKAEEGVNLLSNIMKGTEIWSMGRTLGRLAQRSDFNLERDLVASVGTLFLKVPEDMQVVYEPFMRVMVGLSLHAVERGGKAGVIVHRPLFMLDEAAALGNIPELEQGMGHLRAYARAVLVFQDVGQLQATYRKWKSLLANASCQVFFGVNDQDTAEMVSKMIGERTVEVRSVGMNHGASAVLAHHQNSGVGEAGRRLMLPSEIMRMGKHKALVFMRGLPHPILAERMEYFRERMFRGMFDAWRSAGAAALPLLLEHKPLRLERQALRLEMKPLQIEHH
jgi:type IV secretion system protein VirD4